MTRLALIAALLAAGWSPAAHCLAASGAAEPEASCHGGAAPKPARAPMPADCAVMACCQASLLPAAIVAPAPESSAPILAALESLILVPPAPPAAFAPFVPPGPPGVLLAVSLLGRAPPVA